MMWDGPVEDNHVIIYYRDGHSPGAIDYLVEQLRLDGFAWTIGDGYRRAEDANLKLCYYGYLPDEREPVFCTMTGETDDGDLVSTTLPCTIVVLVDVG